MDKSQETKDLIICPIAEGIKFRQDQILNSQYTKDLIICPIDYGNKFRQDQISNSQFLILHF
jgi:hypothetical protein